MAKRNIVVIGASAGGFEAIKTLVSSLPADLDAAIFIVWHMSPDVSGVMPQVLNRYHTIPAANAIDGESVAFNRIYVAPPDRHMILEDGVIRLTRGPKENRFRPAVDPLFRSVAFQYKSRVIGIILSGALDDGTSGLWMVKHRGGIAIVQDPDDAAVPSMPENALRAVSADYCVPINKIGELMTKLTQEEAGEVDELGIEENDRIAFELSMTTGGHFDEEGISSLGSPSCYACPECHGVLFKIREGNSLRYRCHTGHAYSADTLLASISENIEDALWSAIRSVEESIMLLNGFGDHYAAKNEPKIAAAYFKKAHEAANRNEWVRQAVLSHDRLSSDKINEASGISQKGSKFQYF